ncbi:MAG: hypothetical protein NVV66_00320 [Cellulomonas sp.]|uniref:hypothetical protein n=1 Tax=Cellulomonas sp. TaxID=40001 RepID=UPI0025837F1D|nr:hypothetical protein [Cellulomonas sp.]MCR6703195.1 hypothetical protein [Cellulomonas sp.]
MSSRPNPRCEPRSSRPARRQNCAIVDQLVTDGTSAFEARVAAGACLGAATAALLAIAEAEGSLTDVITQALQILGPGEDKVP